ncbi:MAG: MEKHLA domain-containing protein [Verrucomicrobiales bacterium]|nr:MEKHLA domain-containing protein [Verrucomicrobiales bacterium]
MQFPDESNAFQALHVKLLLRSFEELTGRSLVTRSGNEREDARALFTSPFFVASHNTEEDPVLTYGNQTALDLFEMEWDEFTSTPSRFTAETPERAERERLLEAVRTSGFIDDYSGIRISKTGKRFLIKQATVWNLIDETGSRVGQAATFAGWEPLS